MILALHGALFVVYERQKEGGDGVCTLHLNYTPRLFIFMHSTLVNL